MSKCPKLKILESYNHLGNKEEIKNSDSYESRPRQLTLSAAQNNYEIAKLKYNELFDYLNESTSLFKHQKIRLIKPSILLLYDASEHLKKANKKIGCTKVLEDIDNEVALLQQKLEALGKESVSRQNDMKLDSSATISGQNVSLSSKNCPPDCLLHRIQLLENSDNDELSKDSSFLNNQETFIPSKGEISVSNDVKKQEILPTSSSRIIKKNNGKRKIRGSTSSAKQLKIQDSFSISVELFENLPADCSNNRKMIRYLKSCKNVNQLLLNILFRKQKQSDKLNSKQSEKDIEV